MSTLLVSCILIFPNTKVTSFIQANGYADLSGAKGQTGSGKEFRLLHREDVSTPTGSNALRIPARSLHNGKELALRAPVCRPPTCWFADGSPLGLLEGELQSGVQRLEAILQRVLLVEFHQLLEREQQNRCSSRGPAHKGGRQSWKEPHPTPCGKQPPLLRSLATDSLKAPHDRELTPFPAARTVLWGRNHIVSRQFS